MPLGELHARRLETVATVVEAALDRVERVLGGIEEPGEAERPDSRFTPEQTREARREMARIRSRLGEALRHFSIQRQRLDPRQVLAAELSTLWVVLENARPERMKGYDKEFTPADRKAWEELIRTLLEDIDKLRAILRDARE